MRLVAYWRMRVDPDGVEADADAHHDSRRLHLSQSFGGMWFLDGALDPIGGSIVERELRRIEDELFRTDWADTRRPEPLFSVLVGYETFAGSVCELDDGTVVSPGSLRPWLERAWVERVVFDGPSRVIDVGVHRRLFTGATRRAVEVRHRECFHHFCDVPAERCEIDHIQPYADGGLTIQENGRPACAFHNRSRHRRT